MKLRNQNGTALIVVLLIITVFFVLGLSIISSALSNTRQVNNTEKEMQAVDLAEMGIIYFQTAVENAYKEVNKDIGVNLKEYISDHKINSKEDFMNTFKKDLELEIAALINEKEIVMNTDSNAKFRFSHSPPIVTSNNTIEITFASNGIIGTEDEKNYVISATIHVIPAPFL